MISGQEHIPSEEEIHEIIKRHLKTIDHDKNNIEIGFFGGNFTGLSIAKQEELLTAVSPYIKNHQVDAIRLSTRPDYINEENLILLKKFGVKTIELGAQSMDDDVLRLIGRGHTEADIVTASQLIRKHGFSLGLQMMTGLPGDTRDKSLATAKKIIALGADNTRIYPLLIIRQTALEELYNKGEYFTQTPDIAIRQVTELYRLFEEHEVKIIRVGLHPSEGLISGENYVAGPFHPSFRELVLTAIWRDELKPLMTGNRNRSIIINVNPGEINYAVGHESSNKAMLKRHFYSVEFKSDSSLKGRIFHADYR